MKRWTIWRSTWCLHAAISCVEKTPPQNSVLLSLNNNSLSLWHEHDAHFYGYYTATVRQYLLCGPSLDRKYGLLPPRMMLIVCISNAVLSCSIYYITCTVTTCNSHEALQSMPTCSPFNGHATFRFATKHFHTNFDSIEATRTQRYVCGDRCCMLHVHTITSDWKDCSFYTNKLFLLHHSNLSYQRFYHSMYIWPVVFCGIEAERGDKPLRTSPSIEGERAPSPFPPGSLGSLDPPPNVNSTT